MKSETKYSHRILAMILCIIMLFFMCDNALITLAQASDSPAAADLQEETCEDIKARLLEQIMYDGWDPYSEDMTIDEFFALMELFDDGTLPLNRISSYALTIGAEAAEDPCIPRTKFMFAGLEDYVRIEGSSDTNAPQDYDNKIDYEPDGSGGYYYPSGLDPYDAGYMRPPADWNGIATDDSTNRAVLVSKDVNAGDNSIAGDVIQDKFAEYTGYYVKQVTIDGANINVLGMIEVGGRYIYYYLSAEDQNTQVSTTTLPDEAKFIIEYVPIEHTVSYIVELGSSDVTDETTPEDVVFYGKNAHQDISWADGIFGENRPNLTTDGAYSFDVTVPYGYELDIYISINMSPDIPYQSIALQADSFPVTIKHTGTKQEAHDAWLDAYSEYLNEQGFINGNIRSYITETEKPDGGIALEWTNKNDLNKPAHDSILERMAERINDFIVHNNGYALGQYPQYNKKNESDGFKLIPNDNGPAEHTMLETFYNHLVKADRTITAVLTKQPDPTFDVSEILKQSSGAVGRGSSATEDFAFGDYDADYLYHLENGTGYNGSDDPIRHSAVYPNVETADGWGWQNNKDDPKKKSFQIRSAKNEESRRRHILLQLGIPNKQRI